MSGIALLLVVVVFKCAVFKFVRRDVGSRVRAARTGQV